ncbi:MAG: hypothetical protein ACYDB6_02950 [Candidatus Limnocylindrales bacterium]
MTVVAVVADPEAGVRPPCPCHETAPRGTAGGWHQRQGPAPLLRDLHGADASYGALPRWVDHAYRVRLADGRWAWYAEPYDLDEAAFADLALLAAHGFDVMVSAWRARHYPGHTTAVQITVAALEEPA